MFALTPEVLKYFGGAVHMYMEGSPKTSYSASSTNAPPLPGNVGKVAAIATSLISPRRFTEGTAGTLSPSATLSPLSNWGNTALARASPMSASQVM